MNLPIRGDMSFRRKRLSVSAEQFNELSAQGITFPTNPLCIVGDLTFEPPITLNGCVVIGPSSIGRYSYVGNFSSIDNFTTIGRYCSIASGCTIGAASHPIDWLSTHPFQYHKFTAPDVSIRERLPMETKIGNDVWIGANSVIFAGVTIGNGAIIGAGSVVNRHVPPYAIVTGAPGRLRRMRFGPEIVAELEALKWWDLEPADIAELPFDDLPACLALLRENRVATA